MWKRVKRRLENSVGVGKVNLIGESKREVNIWLDPARLESLGLGVNEVINESSRKMSILPWKAQQKRIRVSSKGFRKASEVSGYPEMIVAWRDGRPIRLKEIASIKDGIKESRSSPPVEMVTAHATREVVLSAGAINSPQLLQLSGIGSSAAAARARHRGGA